MPPVCEMFFEKKKLLKICLYVPYIIVKGQQENPVHNSFFCKLQ